MGMCVDRTIHTCAPSQPHSCYQLQCPRGEAQTLVQEGDVQARLWQRQLPWRWFLWEPGETHQRLEKGCFESENYKQPQPRPAPGYPAPRYHFLLHAKPFAVLYLHDSRPKRWDLLMVPLYR